MTCRAGVHLVFDGVVRSARCRTALLVFLVHLGIDRIAAFEDLALSGAGVLLIHHFCLSTSGSLSKTVLLLGLSVFLEGGMGRLGRAGFGMSGRVDRGGAFGFGAN
eukprot:412095-Rhodomonas_salina.4